MGEAEMIFGIIGGGLLILAVLFVGFQFFTSFYDLDSYDGDLDIDTDAIDDLGEEMEEASDAVFENFDSEGITRTIVSWGVAIGIVVGIILVVYIITKP